MQSLDSRLADLFNEDGATTDVKRLAREASDSDSESDTDLIKRANRLLDMKTDDVLPGLGDLDQVENSNKKEDTKDTGVKKEENEVKVETDVSAKQPFSEPSVAPIQMSSANQSIPVIGGLARLSQPITDGSSTPTLDEAPYSPPPKTYMPTSLPGGLPVPTYGGDALSFLTKIMGNPVKPDTSLTQNPPATSAVTQPSVSANPVYGSWPVPPPTWPPANPLPAPTTISSPIWTSTSPLPTLPPPPTFTWPTSSDQALPSPWQGLSSTVSNQPASIPNPPASSVTTQATNSNLPMMQPPNHALFQRPPLPAFSDTPVATAPPPAKKGKWDVKDTDYR